MNYLITIFFKIYSMFIPLKTNSIDPYVPNKIMMLDEITNEITPIYTHSWLKDPLLIIYNINRFFMKLKMYPKGTYLYKIGNDTFLGNEKDMMSMSINSVTKDAKPLFSEIELQDDTKEIETRITYKKDITDLSIEYMNCLQHFTPLEFIKIVESLHGKQILSQNQTIKQISIIRSSDLEEICFTCDEKINIKKNL